MSAFDLTLFPLTIEGGRELHTLPGLLALGAPRKAARLRQNDLLILYLEARDGVGKPPPFSAAQQHEIIGRLAETYFQSSGTVTSGLRATAARLNDFLLNRNLKAKQEGQLSGSLVVAAEHAGTLYIVHAGPNHSYFLGKGGAQHFADGQSLRGLGLSRNLSSRFYQTRLEAGDLLVICPAAPEAWSKSLTGSPQLSFEAVRRRLVSGSPADLRAGVARFSAGKGLVNTWRPARAEGAQPEPRPFAEPTVAGAAEPREKRGTTSPAGVWQQLAGRFFHRPAAEKPAAQPASVEDAPRIPGGKVMPTAPTLESPAPAAEMTPQRAEPAAAFAEPIHQEALESGQPAAQTHAQAEPAASQPPSPVERTAAAAAQARFLRGETGQRVSAPPAVRPPFSGAGETQTRPIAPQTGAEARRPSSALRRAASAPARGGADEAMRPAGPSAFDQFGAWLAPKWRALKAGVKRAKRGAAAALAAALPKRPEQPREPLINLSPGSMLMVAIIVPFMVVVAATTVYFRAGRAQQFEALMGQAEQYAAQASRQADPALLKQGWEATYDLILEAEKYGSSERSKSLKVQALTALDTLQGVERLEFQPATPVAFPSTAVFTRMVATLNQVFLLDSSTGSIRSMTRITTGGYEQNLNFNCAPQKAGALIIGPLIDIAELPINNDLDAEIMGIDAGGNLVYCASNKTGIDSQPLQIPDMGWGKITAITTSGDTLYVLDPMLNAVYRYDGEKGVFTGSPHFYFGDDIPDHLSDVIDMAIDQEFLYLLHANGQMTICTTGGVNYRPARCDDPVPYGDSREGRDPAPLALPDSRLSLIQTTQPPDPSLFALDTLNRSVYHLSQRRLNFQREYREMPGGDYPFPDRAPTAFAVTPNRRVLIAFDNEVFFTPLP